MREITNDQVLTVDIFNEAMKEIATKDMVREAVKEMTTKEMVKETVGEAVKHFERYADSRIAASESKMKEGFDIMFGLYEKIDQKLDDALMIKADKVDVLDIHKRVALIGSKLA